MGAEGESLNWGCLILPSLATIKSFTFIFFFKCAISYTAEKSKHFLGLLSDDSFSKSNYCLSLFPAP